ncbi:hypothetical protein GPUN_2042 [Glaciecola punicea ACAM 611]|uniref:Uncharacterized protein n=1 Tax=Glaciecola punicea ACAM 611 TaxID=1121923 RepID=H5TCY0_9ALTE|nr:hypothetical protein GPUN_2042 [Glaciecola punicea ACAM 611]
MLGLVATATFVKADLFNLHMVKRHYAIVLILLPTRLL